MLRTGFILVVLAALLTLIAHHVETLQWTPLRTPLSFANQEQVTRSFVADHQTIYSLVIDLKRKIPFEQLSDIVDDWPQTKHADGRTTTAPTITYSVLCEGRQVFQIAQAHGSEWGQTVGVIVGTFPGIAGKRYTVEAHVLKTAPDLQKLDPYLEVESSPDDYKHAFISGSITALIAIAALILGIILLIIVGSKTLMRRLQRKSSITTGSDVAR